MCSRSTRLIWLCVTAQASAPYLSAYPQLRRVMDFVDMDSDKWRQYAQANRGPARMIYQREARKLAAFERSVATQFDASVFVSEAEAEFFRQQLAEVAGKIRGIPNGVDGEYWNPDRNYADPYRPGERVVVFVGAMDYRANVHAAQWFASEVWPKIRDRQREAQLLHCRQQTNCCRARAGTTARASPLPGGSKTCGRIWRMHMPWRHPCALLAASRTRYWRRWRWEKFCWRRLRPSKASRISPVAKAASTLRPRSWRTKPCVGWTQPEIARVPAARAKVLSRYDWGRNLDIYESVLCDARARGKQPPKDAARSSRR